MKFLLPLLLTAALGHAADVLGQIGDIQLTTAETREAIAGLQASQDAALAKDPAAVGQYVRALLVQRLVLRQAGESKFDQDPAVIAKLVRARETALAEAFLQSHSEPPKDYPGEDELQAAYDSARPSLLLPKAWRLAQIFLKDEARLAEVRKQLAAKGADFAAIARASSEEKATAAHGGEIGWLTEAQLQPAIKDKLPRLAAGTVSEPIKLEDGWHILKLLEVREPATATLAQVRPQLTARLRADKAKQLRADYLASLVKDHPLAINEIELSKILSSP